MPHRKSRNTYGKNTSRSSSPCHRRAAGIGAACARVLASQGAQVTLAGINELAGAKIAQEIESEVWHVDLAETGALETLELDIDILVNNAGAQQNDTIPQVSLED